MFGGPTKRFIKTLFHSKRIVKKILSVCVVKLQWPLYIVKMYPIHPLSGHGQSKTPCQMLKHSFKMKEDARGSAGTETIRRRSGK